MIKVTSTLAYASKELKQYRSNVTIDGSRAEIVCEIEAMIHSFLDDPELESIYLDISTEIEKARLEDLERTLRGLKND